MEGEGSLKFHILNKDYYLRFSICQSSKDLALMEELKTFNKLGKTLSIRNHDDVAFLSTSKGINMINLTISPSDFITNVLIPLFYNLT